MRHDGRNKILLYYTFSEIYPISLIERENTINNEDYCINSTDLVPACNKSILTYFFDHDEEEDKAASSFSLLTVSKVILDCDFNLLYQQKEEGTKTTLKLVAPLIHIFPVTSVTENDIDSSPVLAPASDDDSSINKSCNNLTNSHPIQT